MKRIFSVRDDWTGVVLRLTLGLVLFPHGAQKMLGWFGGPGFDGFLGFFTNVLHKPAALGVLAIAIEFFGALFLILGLGSRVWGLAITGLFLGIISTVHFQNGFFMNWSGSAAGEGYEYHLLVIGLALALIVNGSGKLSLDSLLGGRFLRTAEPVTA